LRRDPLKKETIRGALVAAVHRPEELSERRAPAVAFVGRSNVGKSSLLNRLLGKASARVSKTPGRTRGIYFYDTGGEEEYADLPGTGFARVSQSERSGWSVLADRFFRGGGVALAVHLIDGRVADAPVDLAMRDYLAEVGVASLVVATKWDRLSAREQSECRRRMEAVHGGVLPVSARTGEGIEHLRREIRRRLADAGIERLEKGEETTHG
jgi:GTP-binding protein